MLKTEKTEKKEKASQKRKCQKLQFLTQIFKYKHFSNIFIKNNFYKHFRQPK